VPFDVVVVGSINLDLVASADRLPGPGETVLGSHFAEHPGGKGLNQAVAAARAGGSVAMIGAVGDDDAGEVLRRVANIERIDTSQISVVAGAATGRAIIVVDRTAENSIVVIPGANSTVEVDSLPSAVSRATIVLAQLEVPVSAVIRAFAAARAARCRTVLNPAPAPIDRLPAELLANCDVIVPNEHEVELLGGVEFLLGNGVGSVVVTRGAAGVSVYEAAGGTPWHVDAFEVDPIDTTGAGDTFCGAFAARLAAGDTLQRAVRAGAAAGALATTVAGAVPSIPDAAAIERLITA
jgi:ribokinase